MTKEQIIDEEEPTSPPWQVAGNALNRAKNDWSGGWKLLSRDAKIQVVSYQLFMFFSTSGGETIAAKDMNEAYLMVIDYIDKGW